MDAKARQLIKSTPVQDALDTLDIKQRRYVLQVTLGAMSPTHAALDAGFKSPPKSRAVEHAVTVLRVEMARDLDITFEDIKRGYMGAITLAEAQGEPGIMLQGWEKMARLLGHDKDPESRRPINIENMTYIDLRDMPEDQLDKIIEQAPRAIEGTTGE